MFKKILITIILISLTSIANGASNGLYANLQLGSGNTNINNADSKSGFTGRIAAGYQFTQNWAAELGYTKFSNSDVDFKHAYRITSATVKESAVDLVAKAMLPLGPIGVFGTLGGSYLSDSGSHNSTNVLWPTYGLGMSFALIDSLPITASWQRIQKISSTNSGNLQSTNFYSLGLEYHFG